MPERGNDASLLLFPLNELPEWTMSQNPAQPWTASGSQLLSKGFSDRVHQAGPAQPLQRERGNLGSRTGTGSAFTDSQGGSRWLTF